MHIVLVTHYAGCVEFDVAGVESNVVAVESNVVAIESNVAGAESASVSVESASAGTESDSIRATADGFLISSFKEGLFQQVSGVSVSGDNPLSLIALPTDNYC